MFWNFQGLYSTIHHRGSSSTYSLRHLMYPTKYKCYIDRAINKINFYLIIFKTMYYLIFYLLTLSSHTTIYILYTHMYNSEYLLVEFNLHFKLGTLIIVYTTKYIQDHQNTGLSRPCLCSRIYVRS